MIYIVSASFEALETSLYTDCGLLFSSKGNYAY